MLNPRVAIICDYAEEGWPSMDLVGEMLWQHLNSLSVRARRIRPPMRKRFSAWHQRLRNGDRFLARFWDYPRILRQCRSDFDVYHVVDHSYSHLVHELPAERTVVTCHDLDTFECLLQPHRSIRSRTFQAMTQRILDGFRRAARIVCVSKATRDALQEAGVADSKRLMVVENGVDPVFCPEPNGVVDARVHAEVERLLGPANAKTVELLHVGSTAPRKRVDFLLKILAELQKTRPDIRLVRVGGFTPELRAQIDRLDLENSIWEVPFVSKEVLAAIYRRASLVLLPSSSEGFGLPVIEALACGTSVVASGIPVLREVGGSAVSYCPVNNLGSWTRTILSKLEDHSDVDEKNAARQANLARARQFSWQRNAEAMAAVYRELSYA